MRLVYVSMLRRSELIPCFSSGRHESPLWINAEHPTRRKRPTTSPSHHHHGFDESFE
ncbi:unnamed protein product [Periconia digitata]|uniref:Uncharacterized protein n=1 Tax=Periconia digitata TaxID=1303443 RepID=A0A9W4XM97_9PLEO|nr:unnamed protein product [Periconia digitata]